MADQETFQAIAELIDQRVNQRIAEVERSLGEFVQQVSTWMEWMEQNIQAVQVPNVGVVANGKWEEFVRWEHARIVGEGGVESPVMAATQDEVTVPRSKKRKGEA